MPLIKSTRIALKHLRRFIAGFVSVSTFAPIFMGKITDFPFAQNLEQDSYELASDQDSATFKQKQNDKKYTAKTAR